MTPNDIDNRRRMCGIGVAPVTPAKFAIFRIQQRQPSRRGSRAAGQVPREGGRAPISVEGERWVLAEVSMTGMQIGGHFEPREWRSGRRLAQRSRAVARFQRLPDDSRLCEPAFLRVAAQ